MALFNERRTAQTAAYLLHRAGGTLPFIKLIKLMYLAERLSLLRYGEPITGDRLIAMPHGPVLSRTYDHIKGAAQSCEGGWDTWVSDQANYMVSLRDASMLRTPERDLLALSDSDLEVLGETWRDFGHWERWDLVRYTHENLPEWQDPNGSSYDITYDKLFAVLGFDETQTQALTRRLAEEEALFS